MCSSDLTPAALMVGVGRGAQAGILIRGGEILEKAERLTTVVFDKTGTLTRGEPALTDLQPCGRCDHDQALRLAASLEAGSEHPLAEAILRGAKETGIAPCAVVGFEAVPGHGVCGRVEGREVLLGNHRLMERAGVDVASVGPDMERFQADGKTAMLLACDGELAAVIAVADTIKPEAREAVRSLRAEGVEVVMLTGDNARTAAAIGRALEIDRVIADVLPSDKARVIKELQQSGKVVAMVGDGVNDAPALAAAHVGVAMGSGTDVARESADVVLLGNDLARFVDTIAVARRARAIIWFNFAGTILVDVLGIILAYFGYIGPVASVQVHTGSELAFILNSARLLPRWIPFRGKATTGAPVATGPVEARTIG